MNPTIDNLQSSIVNPTWLPPFLRKPDGGPVTLRARLCKGEREVLKKRRPIKVSTWSERHRVVSGSRFPGPWRNDLTPYLAGIMDAAAFPSVRTTILCKAPQIGGTEAINNFVGYCIDRDPGPVLYVYPDSVTGRENMKDRILPMIEDSRRLRSYMTGWEDDKASIRIKLLHMPIYLAWAGSASRLGNKPIKHVIFDETDKYPAVADKRETDPISLGEKRTITYQYDHKIWKISTPTIESAPISKAMREEAQVIFDYWVRCPGCGKRHVMDFDQIKWNKEPDEDGKETHPHPERMRSLGLAWYECPHCECQWDDGWRDKAVKRGEWRARSVEFEVPKVPKVKKGDIPIKTPHSPLQTPNLPLFAYLREYRPQKIGFHLPSWISPFVSLSEVAAAFLKGLKDVNALKDFTNAHKAEPWIIRKQERKEDAILALRDDRPRGLVPAGDVVSCVTAGVDTQDVGFWYEIRGWGYGLDLESWGVREGYVETFGALERILWEDEYLDVDGKPYHVQLVVQDAMGHRTSDVYDFARMHRGHLLPFQGVQTMAAPYGITDVEFYPGTKKPIPGGIKLLRGHVTYFKNTLSNKLNIAPSDPGSWHLNSETSFEWARQMCAEFVNEKGFWEAKSGAANHGWDCSVENLVAAELLGVRHWKKGLKRSATRTTDKKAQAQNGRRRGYQRPAWMNNR